MADAPKPDEQDPHTLILDPSKFKISNDEQVIITDPALIAALRAANDEHVGGHGIGVGITVSSS